MLAVGSDDESFPSAIAALAVLHFRLFSPKIVPLSRPLRQSLCLAA